MALLILALLQRIFLMSSLMLLLVWLIFFMVLIKLLPILGTISGKTVKLMVLARSEERRVGKECCSLWAMVYAEKYLMTSPASSLSSRSGRLYLAYMAQIDS